MQWFLVALSFALPEPMPGELPSMDARPMGPGPLAQIACELEVELHRATGSLPDALSTTVAATDLYCLHDLQLCTLHPAQASDQLTAARRWFCEEA